MEEKEKQEAVEEPGFISFKMEDDVLFKTLPTRKYTNRPAYAPINHKKITAFIPGTIMKVCVKEKHKVKAGDNLLVLQAMKMDNHLISPSSTTVKKVYVKQGDVVIKNQILVELR